MRRAERRVESIWFRGSAVARFGEVLLLSGHRLGTIRNLPIRRIDDDVRAFEARVGVVLRHPDATQIRGVTRSPQRRRRQRERGYFFGAPG